MCVHACVLCVCVCDHVDIVNSSGERKRVGEGGSEQEDGDRHRPGEAEKKVQILKNMNFQLVSISPQCFLFSECHLDFSFPFF